MNQLSLIFPATQVLLTALILAVSLGSCTSQAGNASNSNQDRVAERSKNMKINIKIADKTVTATLVNNATTRDFISFLPLNLSMDDLFGREKFAHLPRALSEKGPRRSSYEVGDIAHWSPAHDVAIYYRQDSESIPSPGVIPIGKLDGGVGAFNVPGSMKVTIELAK